MVQGADWIERRQVANRSLVQALQRDLDPGEAEAIALAVEVSADLLLMDERLGRDVARHLGLRPMGVIGLLIEAKRRKRLQAVKPLLDTLRDRSGFRISEQLYARVLADTGEGDLA